MIRTGAPASKACRGYLALARRLGLCGALALIAVLVQGCAARQLSEAQDAFSKGAAVENNLDVEKARTGADIGLSAYSPAVLYYKQVDALLKREVAEHRQELVADRLLGNVYALRALALWRLSNLSVDGEVPAARRPVSGRAPDAARAPAAAGGEVERYRAEAEAVAREALRMPDEQLGARDRFMMRILPRLLDHDAGMQLAGDPDRAHAFFKSAYDGIDGEIAGIPPRHDAVAYARMAQLQTLVAWSAAINAAPRTAAARFDRGNVAACRNEWIVPRLNRTIDEVDSFLPHGEGQRSEFVASRLRRIGFDVPAAGPMLPAANATACPLK